MNAHFRTRDLLLEQATSCVRHLHQPCTDTPLLRQLALCALASRQLRNPVLQQQMRQQLDAVSDQLGGDSAAGLVPPPGRHSCDGLSEAVLTWAHALGAGLHDSHSRLAQAEAVLERRFWQPAYGLYADHANLDWQIAPYRSQRANMRACEALLSAFEASGEPGYIRRAETVAYNITVRQAGMTGGVVWEHYFPDWSPDWDEPHHASATAAGCDPGQQIAWALLLLRLERHPVALARSAAWMLPRARQLFNLGIERGWDQQSGDICGGAQLATLLNTLASAALLAVRCGQQPYLVWHDRLWTQVWPRLRPSSNACAADIAYQLLRVADLLIAPG